MYSYSVTDKVDFEEDSEIFLLYLTENIYCDPSIEPPRQDGSNEGCNICFYGENKDYCPENIHATHS